VKRERGFISRDRPRDCERRVPVEHATGPIRVREGRSGASTRESGDLPIPILEPKNRAGCPGKGEKRMTETLGVLLCSHGSRDPKAAVEFDALALALRDRIDWAVVDWGYLEFARPTIREGLDRLRAAGVTRAFAVPGMLFAAGHAKSDIPAALNAYMAEHPGMRIDYGRELAVDVRMMRAAGARIEEALRAAGDGVSRHDTLLMVVGRGSADPDANSNVAKITRMLWEGMGFGWAETAYSGVTFPMVEPALERAVKLGFKRIVVFPYFLFTGILVRRIYEHTDLVAAKHPEIEFVKAPYLNDHPLVIDAFEERIREVPEGAAVMNCQLCKYREHVLGFKAEVGLPSANNHAHLEGIGTDDDHDHDDHGHHHDHDHGHDHHHHSHIPPHPHADHPMGPKSMITSGS